MRYRRAWVNGGTYFFTVNLAQRPRFLLVDYVDVLRKVVGMVKERHPFTIDDSDFA
jgi:putative transposase